MYIISLDTKSLLTRPQDLTGIYCYYMYVLTNNVSHPVKIKYLLLLLLLLQVEYGDNIIFSIFTLRVDFHIAFLVIWL